MTEPTVAVLGGTSLGQTARRYFLSTRPKFLSASILPLLIGSAWGWHQAGTFDSAVFFLAFATVLAVHAAANVYNDVYDDMNGNDRVNEGRISPYTGGSRFIQNGVLSARQMLRLGGWLMIVAIISGTALVFLKGPNVIAFGFIGAALGVMYSAPPFSLSARSLGEATIGIAFGALPVLGGAWLQSGEITLNALLISVPISMWVMAILLINEVPDVDADASVNRKTLVVRFGIQRTRTIYLALHAIAFLSFVAAAFNGLIPIWGASFPALILIGGFKASRGIKEPSTDTKALRASIEMTLALHMLGGIWLIGVLLVHGYF